ncbi:hypothetical protein IFM46972_08160 [Aspergillus udagawae]|uniref:Uncharacterized protein n=1 Tax=Aspergillus udagawae TaxID=91492 RepID=A0A8H3P5M7_9EURO|nr:hypothetical protein IFM46972_08160 [Aspergillus udagawae]
MSNDDPVVLLQRGEIMEDKQVAAFKDILERPRIRCPKYHSHPWDIIQKLHLGDVVREAIPLKDCLIFQESAQIDLAVEPSGISRVRRLCELVEFKRLSEEDPIIQMQPDGDPRMRIFNGYNHILRRYTEARALRQVDGALKLWYEKEIGNLESHIGRLGYVYFLRGMTSYRSSLGCHGNCANLSFVGDMSPWPL